MSRYFTKPHLGIYIRSTSLIISKSIYMELSNKNFKIMKSYYVDDNLLLRNQRISLVLLRK